MQHAGERLQSPAWHAPALPPLAARPCHCALLVSARVPPVRVTLPQFHHCRAQGVSAAQSRPLADLCCPLSSSIDAGQPWPCAGARVAPELPAQAVTLRHGQRSLTSGKPSWATHVVDSRARAPRRLGQGEHPAVGHGGWQQVGHGHLGDLAGGACPAGPGVPEAERHRADGPAQRTATSVCKHISVGGSEVG